MPDLVTAMIAMERAQASYRMVVLTLTNRSAEVVLIDPYNLCSDGELKSPLFRVQDANGKRVRYTGPSYKRGEPDFRSFLPLAPGRSMTSRCSLKYFYSFEQAASPYQIMYSTYNMHPQVTYFQINSNVITIE